MVDNLVIRRADREDYYAVATMHVQAWQHRYGTFVPARYLQGLDTISFVQEYSRLTLTAGQAMLVAESDGIPVGLALFGLDPADPHQGWIEALYVDHRTQRGGVGRRLLQRVLAELGCSKVALHCAEGNAGGRAFWEGNGFRAVGDGLPYPIDGYGQVETVKYVLCVQQG